jgi:hypothetical protein
VEVCWTSDSWAQKNLGSRGEKSRNSDKRALMGVECRFWGMSQPNLPNENTEEPSGYRERNGPLLTFHEGYLVDGDPSDLDVKKNSGREGREGRKVWAWWAWEVVKENWPGVVVRFGCGGRSCSVPSTVVE